MTAAEKAERTFASLDSLPDDAWVDAQIVRRMFKVSSATLWRWKKAGGILPASKKFGRGDRWRMGDLRRVAQS
jgi:hypothetical protein